MARFNYVDAIVWLIDTPLLEPALLELEKKEIDVKRVMRVFTVLEVGYFSEESLKIVLTPEHCRDLFRQACALDNKEITLHCLLTENCGDLIYLLGNEEETPLSFFMRHSLPRVRYLLRRGLVDINAKDVDGKTFLIHAAISGKVEWFNVGLEYGATLTEYSDSGMTALHYAVNLGHVECVKVLCKRQCRLIALADANGQTPLHCVSHAGDLECLQILLEYIQKSVKNSDGLTSSDLTSIEGQAELCLVLNKQDDSLGFTPLHYAAISGYVMCLKALLGEQNIQVNVANRFGMTPLHCAAESDSTECEILLLRRGASVNVTNIFSNPPLMSAIWAQNVESLRVLLEAGAAVNQPCYQGAMALHLATEKDNIECLEVLCNVLGILIDLADREYGRTPLHYAALSGQLKLSQEVSSHTGYSVKCAGGPWLYALTPRGQCRA